MSYEFIEPLDKKPKVERKAYRKITTGERILREFLGSKAKYAKVSFARVKGEYKSPAFCSRAVGRVVKRLDLDNEVAVYSDEENVYLEQLK